MTTKPSLMIIGNSNVGKSSITRLLLPNPRKFKGKSGKQPGSTLLIKPITDPALPYQIIDLPGFGYMKGSSNRREEHIKNQIVVHVEKHHQEYFFGLVIINVVRIEDELIKYFVIDEETIPLSFELIKFLNEFEIPLIVIINKVDKITNIDRERILSLFIKSALEYDLTLVPFENNIHQVESGIPYLEFSALKRLNLSKLKKIITFHFSNSK